MSPSLFSTSSTKNSFPHEHHVHDRPKHYLSRFRKMISQSSVNLQINLIEPTLYFQGNPEESLGCFMRGELVVNLSKPTKIKRIEMKFFGRMRAYWPQRSNSNKNTLCEETKIINHNWTFLSPPTANSRSRTLNFTSLLDDHNKNYHLLPAGVYTYPFELFLPGTLPETIKAPFGDVAYKLHATAVKEGFSPNIHTSQRVTIIRSLSEETGIAISRNWLNLVNYEITIPNKAYLIGDSINIDFKAIPQVKRAQVTGLRIELNEQSIYRSRDQSYTDSEILSVYRINESSLNEKDNDQLVLDDIFYHKDFVFPLPKRSKHASCTWPLITISHSLKFYINVKVPSNSKRKGYFANKFKKEVIEVDVPITLLSSKCADDNLPQYDESWINQDYSHNLDDLPPAY